MKKEIMTVYESIQLMKQEGTRLAKPVPVVGMPPMTFLSTFASEGASPQEMAALPCRCPQHLHEFWSIARTAKLFEDQQYGQWGLELFGPEDVANMTDHYQISRQRDFVDGDLIIGKFLGDSDLLLIRCDSTANDFGNVIVVLPLDPRHSWYDVSKSFGEFLDKYVISGGEKFWTKQD